MTPQEQHDAIITRTANSLKTTLSLILPEAGFSPLLPVENYFTRYNMQGTQLLKARKASVGAMLGDYERIYGETHELDAEWWDIEDAADAAAFRLYDNPIQKVNQDRALEGAKTEACDGVKIFREVQRIATGETEWTLSRAALSVFFH